MSIRFPRSALLAALAPALLALALPVLAQQKPLFDAPIVLDSAATRIVKTLDLNGDGWTDAMGWWQNSPAVGGSPTARLFLWINDGAGRLVPFYMTPAESTFPTFGVNLDAHDASDTGDIDQDGDDDFVMSVGNQLRIYLSNGAALPTLFHVMAPSDQLYGVALADFDQDGKLDLAVSVFATLQIHAIDLVNGGTTLLSEHSGFLDAERLVAADLTGDGAPDLLAGGSRVYPVIGGVIQAPTFYPQPWISATGDSLRHDVGDIDGDGDLDVVTFRVPGSGSPAYRVLRRTGPDSLVAEPPQSGGPARRLFDLDGDGDLDGTCCGGGGGSPPPQNTAASKFRIALNDGTGSFATSVDMPGLGSTAIAGVADLDHDGDLDLVAGRCVYYARGPLAASPMPFVGTRTQNERTIHDVEWDGDPDFELTIDGFRANLGDGSEVARTHALPRAPGALQRFGKGMPGDFDGDGVVDLLVLLGTPDAPAGIELLRNVGGGTFESKGMVAGSTGLLAPTGAGLKPYPTELEDSLAVDVDGDGDRDLVRRTRTGYAWSSLWSSWLRNDGPAGFVFAADFPSMVVLHARDLNGDALPDLLGVRDSNSGYSTHELRMAVGLGGGTFGPWDVINYGSGSRAMPPGDQVALADLDLDGDVDIALAAVYSISGPGGSRAKVLLNNGNGVFPEHSLYIDLDYTTTKPGAAAVADLNQDGLADLVFGPLKSAPTAVAIYLRKADNSDWEPPTQQVVFELPAGATIWNTVLNPRDPDGDRDIDLITNRRVLNRTYEMPDAGSRVQLASGLAGTGAIVPTLGAVGPFRVGMNASLRLRGAAPGASGVLCVRPWNVAPPPFGGGHHAASMTGVSAFTASGSAADPAGSGAWSTSFPIHAALAGRTYGYAVRIDDPGAPGGLAISNTLVLSFGP